MQQSADTTLAPAQPLPKNRRFKTLRVLFALMMRELAATESRSSLGFFWLILEPVGALVLLTLVMSLLQRTPPLGTNFPLFYVTGLLPFQMYSQISMKCSSAIRFSKPLLGFPSVTAIDAILARSLVSIVLNVMIFAVMIVIVIEVYGLNVIIDYGRVAECLFLSALLGMGIGVVNVVPFLASPAYANLWSIMNRPLLLVSGVIFLHDNLTPWAQDMLWWNPAVHIVGMMRQAFYPSYTGSYVSATYVILVSLASLAFGLLLIKRFLNAAMDL
jgi:capsular polysaccharide transport system permease protein